MKKLVVLIFSLLFFGCSVLADDKYNTPIPAADDEVTTSGPDTKYSQATQMRFDAFQDAETDLSFDIPEDRKIVKIYQLSKNETYLQKVKIPNAKIIEYTNGTYDIKFKDSPYMIYNYDKEGVLQEISTKTNKGKVPYFTYHYDATGHIKAVEIKPDYYRSYIYDLNGVLIKYVIDNKTYLPNGKLILRRKSNFLI